MNEIGHVVYVMTCAEWTGETWLAGGAMYDLFWGLLANPSKYFFILQNVVIGS